MTLQATPIVTSTLAAVIWPANFVSASRPHRSSIRPIPMITAPATSTAGIPRQTAHPRRRRYVHIAFAWIGHRAEPGCHQAYGSGCEVGDDRGGEPDKRQLTQRNTGAAVGQREQTAGEVVLHHDCIQFRGGSAGQTGSVQAEHRGNTFGANRAGSQNARL